MTQHMSLAARLKAARRAAGYKTAKSFIEQNNIPKSTYSQHEAGTRTPNDDAIAKYSELFNVNAKWLKTGAGSPYSEDTLSQVQNKLDEELLDISNYSAGAIDEGLLSIILEKLFNANKQLKLSNESLAKSASGIYADTISTQSNLETKLQMIDISIKAIMRYINK